MARIPWVERSYGQDALARHHRVVGFSSFALMLGLWLDHVLRRGWSLLDPDETVAPADHTTSESGATLPPGPVPAGLPGAGSLGPPAS